MKIVLHLFLLIALVTGAASAAKACSCNFEAEEFDYAVKNIPVIVAGKLIQVDQVSSSKGRFVSATYRFVVTKSWRGSLTDTVTLQTSASNCHILLKNNRRYVLYLHPDGELSICNRVVENRFRVNAETRKLKAYFTKNKPQSRPNTN